MTDRSPYPGRVKVAFCRRLQDSWPDLADLLGVRQDERRRFRRGYESQDLWEWLDARQKLEVLLARTLQQEITAVVGEPGTHRPGRS